MPAQDEMEWLVYLQKECEPIHTGGLHSLHTISRREGGRKEETLLPPLHGTFLVCSYIIKGPLHFTNKGSQTMILTPYPEKWMA